MSAFYFHLDIATRVFFSVPGWCRLSIILYVGVEGGGPRVVVSTAAFHARARGSVPGLGGLKITKMLPPHPRVKVSIVGSFRDREVACSASDRQGSNFQSCVWRTVSSHLSHHPQEVLLAQFIQYVYKGGLKPDSFHLRWCRSICIQYFHQLFRCSKHCILIAHHHQRCITMINPLSPHDALKHHFTSLETYLIFLQPRVLERKFPWNWFTNTWQFILIFKPHQLIFIHYKSRIATAIHGL